MDSACISPLTKIAALTLLLTTLGCNKSDSAKSAKGLAGSGSTFIYPLMAKWANEYAKKDDGCQISYRSLGSGAGIRQITGNVVDFACSDAPLTDQELAKAPKWGAARFSTFRLSKAGRRPRLQPSRCEGTAEVHGACIGRHFSGKDHEVE